MKPKGSNQDTWISRIKNVWRNCIGGWLTVISLTGCEMTADNVTLPESRPKLVVNAYISPQDTLLMVTVTRSVPIYTPASGSIEFVADASVALSDGTVNVDLAYDKEGRYITEARNLPILPGRSYFLTVTTPDGQQAKASCTVPARANTDITSIQLDSTVINQAPGYTFKEYRLSVEWQDVAGEGDYYRIFAESHSGVYTGIDPAYPDRIDTIYQQISFEQGEEYTRDAGQDGRAFIVRDGKFQWFDNPDTPDSNQAERKLNIRLLTTDRNYYEYQRALENYTNDNPFAEPVLLYSNVEGGLGIFAAYQQYKREFRY